MSVDVMFAIPRMSGWLPQWLELIHGKEQKINRAREVEIGSEPRHYQPRSERGRPVNVDKQRG